MRCPLLIPLSAMSFKEHSFSAVHQSYYFYENNSQMNDPSDHNWNLEILERFQPRILWMLVGPLWFVLNYIIYNDLKIPFIRKEGAKLGQKYSIRLEDHPDLLSCRKCYLRSTNGQIKAIPASWCTGNIQVLVCSPGSNQQALTTLKISLNAHTMPDNKGIYKKKYEWSLGNSAVPTPHQKKSQVLINLSPPVEHLKDEYSRTPEVCIVL